MKAAMAYAYAGGFTLGVQSQFEVTDLYEDPKPYGTDTVLLNDPTKRVWDIEQTEPYELVDAVFSNPPCAPFSPAGYSKNKGSTHWHDDPRLQCHRNAVILGQAADAAAIVIESVRQSLKARRFYEGLTPEGWHLQPVQHNAMHHGIPQNRPRVFWVYSQDPMDFYESTATDTLQPQDLVHPDADPVRTMNPATLEILPNVPQGKALRSYWHHPPGVRGVPSTACRRLAWGKPTPTMAGVRGYVHPEESRYITIPEMQYLCGYPESYAFAGSKNNRVLQMCRAVLPPVGSWIAREVHDQLV